MRFNKRARGIKRSEYERIAARDKRDDIAEAYAGAVVANDDVFVVHLLRF